MQTWKFRTHRVVLRVTLSGVRKSCLAVRTYISKPGTENSGKKQWGNEHAHKKHTIHILYPNAVINRPCIILHWRHQDALFLETSSSPRLSLHWFFFVFVKGAKTLCQSSLLFCNVIDPSYDELLGRLAHKTWTVKLEQVVYAAATAEHSNENHKSELANFPHSLFSLSH